MTCRVLRSARTLHSRYSSGIMSFPSFEFFWLQARLISSLTQGETTASGDSTTINTLRLINSSTIFSHQLSHPAVHPAHHTRRRSHSPAPVADPEQAWCRTRYRYGYGL